MSKSVADKCGEHDPFTDAFDEDMVLGDVATMRLLWSSPHRPEVPGYPLDDVADGRQEQ